MSERLPSGVVLETVARFFGEIGACHLERLEAWIIKVAKETEEITITDFGVIIKLLIQIYICKTHVT